MSGETIELLKNYDPKKMQFPAYVSEKLDGVPVRLISNGVAVQALTRQGEFIRSIDHIIAAVEPIIPVNGSIVGELYIPGKPFKEISGLVRQHSPAPELQLHVFDGDLHPGAADDTYDTRMVVVSYQVKSIGSDLIQMIPRYGVNNDEEVQDVFLNLVRAKPGMEGIVVHSASKTFSPGKRCWGTQRLKPTPTLDLRVESFEEAIDQFDAPKGMVGRINVYYARHVHNDDVVRSVIGIGPGSLTHNERRDLWEAYGNRPLPGNMIIEVKYMPDDTYEALRQPTFVRFRPDKTEGDVHHV
jgi:ATP-dependent DNA ligase